MLPEKLPFFFAPTDNQNNGGFPKVFPFKIIFDNELGMYRQVGSKKLRGLLKRVYERGSLLVGGLNDPVVGQQRLAATFNFIRRNFQIKPGCKILEIGCGEGQLLKKLAKLGAECTGTEPGPQGQKIIKKNIKIIQDFFPSKRITEKFDLICHFTVLEHIENPIKFLQSQRNLLAEKGIIICSFPNCETDLASGDISVFLHEHFNYFTPYSISKVVWQARLFLEKVSKSPDGGVFFAKITRKPGVKSKVQVQYPAFSPNIFEKKAEKLARQVIDFFNGVKQSDVAIYSPLRAMNLCYLAAISDCRLVDDNFNFHAKFLPAFKRQVENFWQLKQNPPRKILIYSRTFGRQIKQKCQKAKELSNTEIKSISDF